MRAVLDACVLYPTLLRQVLLGAAGEGLFEPVWSQRILEEWRRTVLRRHPEDLPALEAGIAAMAARHPGACQPPAPDIEARLSLPDPGDLHVLATALSAEAEAIVTLNLKDFPGRTLAREGALRPMPPDTLMCELWADHPETVADLVRGAVAPFLGTGGTGGRSALRRAALPRLAKALGLR